MKIFTFLIWLLVAWWLIRPILRKEPNLESSPRERDIDVQERATQRLSDLELDYATGKVTEDDYRELKSEKPQEM